MQKLKAFFKSNILKNFFDYGLDISLIFIVVILFSALNRFFEMTTINFILALGIIYSIVRSIFIKHVLIMMIMNILVFFLVFGAISNVHFEAISGIYKSLIVLFSMVIFMALQVFSIIYRAFTYKPEEVKETKTKIGKYIEIIFRFFDFIIFKIQIVIGIMYPIILTIIIILIFSSFYNSAHDFYSTSIEENLGIINPNTGERLVGTNLSDGIYSYVFDLFENRWIYFSTITYFTIGYGDLVPKGTAIEAIVILETLVSNLLNISFFAIYSSLLYEKVVKKE